jgi:hypothetical protein
MKRLSRSATRHLTCGASKHFVANGDDLIQASGYLNLSITLSSASPESRHAGTSCNTSHRASMMVALRNLDFRQRFASLLRLLRESKLDPVVDVVAAVDRP